MKHHTRARHRFAAIAVALALTVTGAVVTGHAAVAAPTAVTATAPAPQAAGKVMVTTADLNLRKSPSTSAKIITTLAKGTKVTVIGSSGIWRKVNVGKRTGWVSGKFLKAVAVKKAATVTVTSRTKLNVALNAKLMFAGNTSKNLVGKTIALQIRAGDKWATVKKAKVTSKKTFTVTVKATQAGAQKYRIYAPSTSTTKPAASKTYKYTVWAWYNIAGNDIDSDGVAGCCGYSTDGVIGGKLYPDSVSFGWGLGAYNNDGWADYNVSYKCTTFRATIGMHDNSKTGSVRAFALGIDSTTVDYGTRGVGAGVEVTTDITDANRIRLDTKLNGNDVWGIAVFGTPQMYCSSQP